MLRLTCYFLFLTLGCLGQVMNESGHLIFPAKVSAEVSPEIKSRYPDHRILTCINGYMILPLACAQSPVELKITDRFGEVVFSKTYSQVINLAFSPQRKSCAFYDGNKLVFLNLVSLQEKSVPGSNIFCLDDEGNVAFYREDNYTVQWNDQSYPVNERIYQMISVNNRIIFYSRNNLFELSDTSLVNLFSISSGRFFDLKNYQGKLYVSIKEEKDEAFVFRLFCSEDWMNFYPLDEKRCSRKGKNSKKEAREKFSNGLSRSSARELIRDPLNFFADTVYQPVGNSYCEIQYYGSPAYLHPGVDLLGYHLQDVHAVKKGFVKSIITTADTFHWRIAISNLDTPGPSNGYLYAHLDQMTIPFAVGDSVEEGDVVGQLVNFPVQGFVHCHFARINDSGAVWGGTWWTLENPLTGMTNFFDTVPPQFELTKGSDVFAFRDSNGIYLSPDSLYGAIKIISKVYDLINSSWRVDVNTIRYNLSPLSSPAVLLLDSFAYEYNFYNDTYSAGSYNTGILNTIYSRDATCYSDGNYNTRDFYHIVTNSDGNDTLDAADSTQFFNTMNFPDGSYIFRVIASDPSGNTSMDSMVVRFKNNLIGTTPVPGEDPFTVFPNPSGDGRFSVVVTSENGGKLELYNPAGVQCLSREIHSGIQRIDFDFPAPGIYFIRFETRKEIRVKKIVVQ